MFRITPFIRPLERTLLPLATRGTLGIRTMSTQAPENRVPLFEVFKSLVLKKAPDRHPPVQVTVLPDHELKAICDKNYAKQLEALNNPPPNPKANNT